MAMIDICTTEEWTAQAAQAGDHYFIFKHSSTCPISARAHREMEEFSRTAKRPILQVLVIESRPLSLHIAQELSIQHASPQAILVVGGQPVWNTSHNHITRAILQEVEATKWL